MTGRQPTGPEPHPDLDLFLRVPTRPDRGAVDRAFDVLLQEGRAAEVAGFDGIVLPFDAAGEDPLVAATAIAAATRRLRIVAAWPIPGATPVYAAKLAVTFQRFSGGRLGWWIDSDGPGVGAAYGDRLVRPQRQGRDAELLDVARQVFAGGPVDVTGRHATVAGGGFADPLSRAPFPEVWVSGTSPAARELAAQHGGRLVVPAGTGVTTGNRSDGAGEIGAGTVGTLAAVTSAAVTSAVETGGAIGGTDPGAGAGADAGIAVELAVVARETAAEAEDVAAAHEPPAGALVGSYDDVADRLADLRAAGVTGVVLGLTPVLEEAYRFGHFVRPLLGTREVATRVA
ncbi:MAG TPA: LLM class flavin-dependent oxidoreductase [Acidimicrobiales bacterium]